ncbi:hypothetical protein SAMN05720354_103228 [Nitrosospira sp. Nsp1]|nr:hypothetical protein SAMN05720354_103228 [Nitrosospira sp. Nsp1]
MWTGQTLLQPISFKSDRLLECVFLNNRGCRVLARRARIDTIHFQEGTVVPFLVVYNPAIPIIILFDSIPDFPTADAAHS